MGKGHEKAFFKNEIQTNNKHIKNWSGSLTISDVQITNWMNFHLTKVRMTIIKKQNNNVEKKIH